MQSHRDGNEVGSRKAVIAALAFVLFVAGDMPPEAAKPIEAPPIPFSLGQTLSQGLSVCLDKKDAIELVEIDAEKGVVAASEAFEKKERCAGVPVFGPTVGRVVFSVRATRDGRPATVKVVEILSGETVLGYFITTAPVSAKVDVTEPPKRGRAI